MYGMQSFNETTGYEKNSFSPGIAQRNKFFGEVNCRLETYVTHYVESFDRRDYVQTEKLILR